MLSLRIKTDNGFSNALSVMTLLREKIYKKESPNVANRTSIWFDEKAFGRGSFHNIQCSYVSNPRTACGQSKVLCDPASFSLLYMHFTWQWQPVFILII